MVGIVISPDNELRKQKLKEHLVSEFSDIVFPQRSRTVCYRWLETIMMLNEGERGKTDLVEMDINTGEATPTRQAV